jgi:RNA polymerase sigma-70 factor (ECF subfamily)
MQQSNLPRDSASAGKGDGNSRISNPADLELMQRMRSGDEDAFAIFYDRFAPGLFSMIHEILHDQKEAEDVLQESFVQMWKRTATYDASRSSLFTWAVMISRHKAIDRLRARQRQSRLKEEVAAETSVADSAPPTDEGDYAVLWNDERKRLQAALAKLGDSQREAIDLAFFGGLTQTQISQRLGAPLGTVKARIRRGLLALRESLGEAFL